MEELAKIVRVLKKLDPDAPHATLLVLDATVGQNAVSQVEAFTQIAGVTGLVMTKLDGTARGGILVALAQKFGVPVHLIGVGEGVDDLEVFDRTHSPAPSPGWRKTHERHHPSRAAAADAARHRVHAAGGVLPVECLWRQMVRRDAGPAHLRRHRLFIIATLIALAATWALTRRLAIMPLISAVVVTVFGGLTLALDDELFIKLKPTIVNTLFGCVLLGGLAFGRSLLAYVLDTMIRLDAEGWRK